VDRVIKKKKWSKKRLLTITGIVAIVALISISYFMTSGKSRLNVDTERITISEIKKGSFQEFIPVNGIVLPLTTIYLDAVEGGRVEDKYVEDGAVVKKDQPILRLSNTDLELSLINQETSVFNLLTQMRISGNAAQQNTIGKLNQYTDVDNALKEAERVYNLDKKLYDQHAIGSQEFKQAENNYNYQLQKKNLTTKILKQDKGERLGQIDVLSGFKVRVDIDEHYISRIFNGLIGGFTLAGKDYKLKITKVFTQVTNSRFQVDMAFMDTVPPGIRRGQTLQIRLSLSDETEAVLVPRGGFFQQTGGNWIFKVSDNGKTAYRVDIQLGRQNPDYYEVLSGLKPGDKVVTSSYENYGNMQELVLKKE